MRTRAQSAEPVAFDIPYLSTTYDYQESDIQTLIDAPTTELVKEFLTSLTAKGQQYDTLKADKLRVDVELENTVRTSETKVKAQKAAVTRNAKEIEELRSKLNNAESARETLSNELEQLRSTTSGSTAETQTLRQRIETLEASNRDALALVESKSTEKDRIATELSEQHGKLLGLRREISQLEERNQSLENAASTQRFKEQSLQQEIDLVKRNNEWHANELQTRTQEHAKFRKERNARIASLQRELEDSTANVETLKRTETTLRQRLEEIQGKADEAFARIANLEEETARKEQGWKAELDGSKRLAELQAQNAATHKARLHEVQGQMDRINEDAREEIGRLQSEIETERADKEQSEAKVAELELQVERLEQQPRASRPGTPMHNGGFDPATPGRAGSPFAVPGSARKYANKLPFTNTEYWAKYNEMQQDLEAERRRTQKLSTAVDEMVTELESRAPEYIEIRKAHDELEQQVLEFSRLLEDANSNRDNALKETERWQSDAEAKTREGEILRQQLRDLATQVKILTVENRCYEEGLDAMSADEKYQLEQMARGEAQNETVTNQFISQQLTIFHNVSELQEQNQRLRDMLRQLGDQMEGEEARRKAAESEANAQEVEELRQQVGRYKDEMQATATQIDSYVKERDMFRRMLQRRGDLHPGMDLQATFGQSVPPATPQRNGTNDVPQTPRSKDMEDLNKLLKEQQAFFDQYRNESSQDRKMLKDQADALGREKSTLQSELTHWKSQKTLSDERLQMLQANYNGLRNENTELQKRSQQMAENAAKQDLRTQQVAEELVEARSMAESFRNENANTKAEKELWKRIESRLTEDNKNLMDKRSRLNKLVTDLQNMQNERELSDSESRRRLQNRVEGLETELTETKKKLDQEVEDARQATLRREYQDGQSRTRIDDLVKSLGNVREELVAAKTTRDQLQARVDEMKIELRSAEERAAALQPRPTPRAEPQQNGQQEEDGEEELSAEQRLALEVSDLRRDLELARNELESARQQVEQYRAIAQGAEEELGSLNETSEQYKEDTDQQIAEKDARASQLQQRVDDLLNELTTSNNELSELRKKQEESDRVLSEHKTNFEADIARLKDDAERYAEEKKLYQEDLKAQAEIAQQAQQSYEDELVKHAEAAKNLKTVRDQYNTLRTEVAGVRAEAEAAKASLERGEESWSEQRERFGWELDELKRRRQDVDEQNRLLHRQMESFSSELSALRSGRTILTGEGEERAGTATGNLQEVIKYLRREKEIVDVQYELSMQESKRLQQQLDYANAQLEDTRQKLAEERRQSADKVASEGSTNKLMQTINELNLFRESSITLRNEARQAREKLEEKSKEVERLLGESEPLKGRVGELEGEVEGKDGEIKLLQDDRDHWRERTQNIISKYDRVDPAELEDMKKQLEELKAEKDRLENEQAPLREQVDEIDAKVEQAVEENSKTFREKLENFRNQAKEQNRKQVAKIKDAEGAVEAANADKVKVAEELDAAKNELEQTKSALQEAQAKATSASVGDAEEGQVDESEDEQAALSAKAAQAEANAAEQSARAEALSSEVQILQNRVSELEGQLAALQQQLDNALQGEEGEIQSGGNADTETLEKLRQDLSTAQQEVETLRANATGGNQAVSEGQPAEGEKHVSDQVAEEVAKLRTEMEQQHELAKQQLKEDHDRRIEAMKNNLRQRMKEEREKIRESMRQELIEEHSTQIQKLNEEHDAAVAKLKDEHKAELDRLTKDGGAAVEKAEADAPAVKSEAASAEWPTEFQILDMMKNNARIRGVFNKNVTQRVRNETERLHTAVAEKDEEIAKLMEAQGAATGNEEDTELQKKLGAAEEEKKELQRKLDAAEDLKNELQQKWNAAEEQKKELQKKIGTTEEDKKEAVRLAVENEGKKSKVQVNMLGIAQAKVAVVRKAAQETPEKTVKEVWEVANKAKPAPKPTAAGGSTASPAPTAPKPAVPESPSQAQGTPAAPSQTQELSEQERISQRQQRFGTGPTNGTPTPPSRPGSFGQPSAPAVNAQSTPATGGTFGQPSQSASSGALGQPPRRPSMSSTPGPNPQAPTFTPGGQQQNVGTGPAALRGALGNARGGIPRPGGAAGRPNSGQFQIQGAAGDQQNQQTPLAGRGGISSGIPRGGPGAPRGGGGRGGPQRGGGGANAGQKRPHDGGESGDGKRMRGGGPGGS
ncbi:Protein mlp1 [Vermiconidia calcicola]|uniref:Protein mlp1 n=1 Tax=Vermiconidia calcicola TaxID=1690605 RepID=A0ACC3N134_9PEZI|nr:Protein mlp1 [Vermiconidia calcicola]